MRVYSEIPSVLQNCRRLQAVADDDIRSQLANSGKKRKELGESMLSMVFTGKKHKR
eukprot:SAG31_NODE_2456_length_5663_cov_8.660361_2_plen_56_part_00